METTTTALLPIACRFVPYDQWLITHVDPSWMVHHLKQWVLSKCLSGVDPPDVPSRHRPVSPITFALNLSRPSLNNNDDVSDLNKRDVAWEDSDDDDLYFSGSESGIRSYWTRKRSQQYGQARKASVASLSTSPLRSTSPTECLGARYTLLMYSTGQTLEDHFTLSWYNLRPNELLELHAAGADLRLARDLPSEYVQPCFESKAWVLRVTWKEGGPWDPHPETSSYKMGSATKRKMARARSDDGLNGPVDGLMGVDREREKDCERVKERRKRRVKLGWKEKWVVIRQGVMTLSRSRTEVSALSFPLNALIAMQSAGHLQRTTPSLITGPWDRIICCKFETTQGKPRQEATSSTLDDCSPSGGDAEVVVDDDDGARTEFDRLSGEWIALDIEDEDAYSAVLRILHRSASPSLRSVFLPPSSDSSDSTPMLTSVASSRIISATSMTNRSLPYQALLRDRPTSTGPVPLPFPEWRMRVVDRARMAGVGVVGDPMKWILWGDETVLLGGAKAGSVQSRRLIGNAALRRGSATDHKLDPVSGIHTSGLPRDGSDLTGHLVEGDISQPEDVSEAEWEDWSWDLDRQKRAAEALLSRTRLRERCRSLSPTLGLYSARKGRALEQSATVSSAATGPSMTPSPSLEVFMPAPFDSPTGSRSSPPLSPGQPDRLRESTMPLLRPRSPLVIEDLYMSTSTESSTSTVTLGSSVSIKSENKKHRPFPVSDVVAQRLWKSKGKERERPDDASTNTSTTLHEPRQHSYLLRSHPSVQYLSANDVYQSTSPSSQTRAFPDKTRPALLRHALSVSSLKLASVSRPGLPSAQLLHDEMDSKRSGLAEGVTIKRRSSGRQLVRLVGDKAEKFMNNALDFVDGR